MKKTYLLLISCIMLLWSCRQENNQWRQSARELRSASIQYLLDQQQEDGSWRSDTHGILKGGVAYTAYLTHVLANSKDSLVQGNATDQAILFLLSQLDSTGGLGYSGKYVVEYPVYATAYLHMVFPELTIAFDTLFKPQFEQFLLAQQFNESRGIDPQHPAYGAWGFGEANLPYGEVGHIDLSHTRRVLEALDSGQLDQQHLAWKQAQIFLDRIQNEDGGFCSSSYTLSANKADDQTNYCVSYASTTADGILALLALPEPPTESVERALSWLVKNEDWMAPSGIPPGSPGNWDMVLHYYHIAVRAQAYAATEQRGLLPAATAKERRSEVVDILVEEQRPDGSYSNPWGAPNKEDDPLLATALAIRALIAVLQ